MVMATTFSEIQTLFHSMPLTKYEIPEGLEAEWLKIAVSDYELNIGCDLRYNSNERAFGECLNTTVCRTLAQMMYVCYLQRELSRVMALNGIYGKDVQLTGQDATKRVTKQELDDQISLVESLLHRQKQHAYG